MFVNGCVFHASVRLARGECLSEHAPAGFTWDRSEHSGAVVVPSRASALGFQESRAVPSEELLTRRRRLGHDALENEGGEKSAGGRRSSPQPLSG